jgi:hypothetical protein
MRLTNNEIVSAAGAMVMLQDEKLPTLLAIKVARISRILTPQAEIINTARNMIVKKFTKRGDDGKPLPVLDDAGNIQPNQVQVSDSQALASELELLGNDAIDLDCPTISQAELELKDKKGNPREFAPMIFIGLGQLFVPTAEVTSPGSEFDTED